jgi:hypothetical protein
VASEVNGNRHALSEAKVATRIHVGEGVVLEHDVMEALWRTRRLDERDRVMPGVAVENYFPGSPMVTRVRGVQ